MDTDVYEEEIERTVLEKPRDGTNWPIGYWYRLLNNAERAYNTTHCNPLTVIYVNTRGIFS